MYLSEIEYTRPEMCQSSVRWRQISSLRYQDGPTLGLCDISKDFQRVVKSQNICGHTVIENSIHKLKTGITINISYRKFEKEIGLLYIALRYIGDSETILGRKLEGWKKKCKVKSHKQFLQCQDD